MYGGQDFELGALMVLTLLCLALVLPRQCKQYLRSLFARNHHPSRNSSRSLPREILEAVEILISRTKPVSASGTYNLPLQL